MHVQKFTQFVLTLITLLILSHQSNGLNFSYESQQELSAMLMLDDFSPKQGGIGSEVILTGDGFTNVTSVEFRGILTAFTIINDHTISTVVPIGMTQPGRIRIKIDTPFEKVVSMMDYTPIPMVISDFLPKKAGVNENITVTGKSFSGITSVDLRGINASFVVENDSTVTVTIPGNYPYQPGNIRIKKTIPGQAGLEKAVSIDQFNRIAKEPTVIATNFRTDPAFTISRLKWNNGNGSRRLVVIKEASNPVDFIPEDGVEYSANRFLWFNTPIDGNFVVFNDRRTPDLRVLGLKLRTDYLARIYEYNGAGDRINYLTQEFAEVSFTMREPEDPIILGSIPKCIKPGRKVKIIGINLEETSEVVLNGDSLDFTVVNDLLIKVDIPEDANNGNITIFEFEVETIMSMDTTFDRLEILPSTPTTPSSNLVVVPTSSVSADISWTAGDGNRQLVVLKESSNPVEFRPDDCEYYRLNREFGAGKDFDGNFVVFGGSTGQVSVTGLSENTSYDVYVFEYNKSVGRAQNYLRNNFLQGSFSTPGASGFRVLKPGMENKDGMIMEGPFMTIYPNPSSNGIVNVNVGNVTEDTPVSLNVYNISGQKILEQKFTGTAAFQVDLYRMNGKGLYLFNILVDDQRQIQRIHVK
jgi:hypothetical protein